MDLEEHVMYQENEILKNRCRNMEKELAEREVYTKEMELAASNAIKELTALRKLMGEYVDAVDNMYTDYDSWYIVHTRVKQAIGLANTDSKEESDDISQL